MVKEESGTEWLQKNLEQNGHKRTLNKMFRGGLGTQWLQKNLEESGYRIIWNTMATKELGIKLLSLISGFNYLLRETMETNQTHHLRQPPFYLNSNK